MYLTHSQFKGSLMKTKIAMSVFIVYMFSGCVVTQVAKVPFDIVNFAIDTTENAVELTGKVIEIGVDTSVKVVKYIAPELKPKIEVPEVNIMTIENKL